MFYLDAHGHNEGGLLAHGPEGTPVPTSPDRPHIESIHLEKTAEKDSDEEAKPAGTGHPTTITDENVMAQLIGVAVLEFGVILHRYGVHPS